MGELKEFVIRLSSNPKIFQVIGLVVVDIPKAYGLLLSRDGSLKLNGYITTNWSHLLLPSKEKSGFRRINSEKHNKYIVTKLNMPNEDMVFCQSPLGNYYSVTYFGNFEDEALNVDESNKQSETLHCTQPKTLHCSQIVEQNYNVVDDRKSNFIETRLFDIELEAIFWNLNFYGSNIK